MLAKTISVVIPFYNNVDWLVEALDSVLNQTYQPFEIIVVNDGSEENMEKFLDKYSEYIVYIQKKNEGPAIARNLGVEKSTGDYIAFLDSDDLWLYNKLEKQIKLMEKHNTIWSHTSYHTFIDGEKHLNEKYQLIDISPYKNNIYPLVLASCPIATPSVMVRGDILRNDKNLRFNPDMRYGQDSYLWINLARKHSILAIETPLTLVRIRGGNASRRVKVQLNAKSIIGKIIKTDRERYKSDELPLIIKTAFNASIFGSNIVNFIERKLSLSKSIEIISSIFYLIPWVLFKTYAKRQLIKSEK